MVPAQPPPAPTCTLTHSKRQSSLPSLCARRFGCADDCGQAGNLTDVIVRLDYDFLRAGLSATLVPAVAALCALLAAPLLSPFSASLSALPRPTPAMSAAPLPLWMHGRVRSAVCNAMVRSPDVITGD